MHRSLQLVGLALGMNFVVGTSHANIMPDNDLYLQDCLECESGVTQAQFNAAISKANSLYGSVIQGQGGRLEIRGNWDDSTVNASATQFDETWQVNMYGGLARRPEVTADGFVLVLCHELGHHLAGFPFVSAWGADEGQSDYFATHDCAQLFWGADFQENARARSTIAAAPKAACDAIWTSRDAQNLCYRTMIASKSLADLLATLGGDEVDWSTPDQAQVDETDHNHPAAQCRLDTYMAGATCTAAYDKNYIPGKRNGEGQNDLAAEQDSARFSCTASGHYQHGLRPRCWFKPSL